MANSIDKSNCLISIQELLKDRNPNFDNAIKTNPKSIKLVRHSDKVKENSVLGKKYEGKSVYDLYRFHYPEFLKWQCEQRPKDMKGVDYLVVFIGEEQCTSRFIGVFKNNGSQPKKDSIFKLVELQGFELLKNQVVIEWGKSTRMFMHNWTTTKEVIQMYKAADSSGIPFFTRYEDVVLDYSQLIKVVKDREWRSKLAACNCIYLILDKKNGKHYIGSTYNRQGILGRWIVYANNGHGDDKSLIKLLKKDQMYAERYFQWSILETLPLTIVQNAAVDREALYKRKFGTLKFGYNNN